MFPHQRKHRWEMRKGVNNKYKNANYINIVFFVCCKLLLAELEPNTWKVQDSKVNFLQETLKSKLNYRHGKSIRALITSSRVCIRKSRKYHHILQKSIYKIYF